MKIKWEVSPRPTCPYRSFHKRGWPIGRFWPHEQRVLLRCPDDYYPSFVKTGNHKLITVRLDLLIDGQTVLRTLKGQFNTLPEAKQAALDFITRYPHRVKQ